MVLEIGHVYPWKVIFTAKTHLIAKTIDGSQVGLLHISEISDYYVGSVPSLFEVGEIYDFLVIDISNNEKIRLSWKLITPRFLKNPFEYNIIETKEGFKTLHEFVMREV